MYSTSSAAASGVGLIIVGILLFIVFIAMVVCIMIMFVSKKSTQRNSKLGQFFNFDHFHLEGLFRILNVICVSEITVTSIAFPLIAFVWGFNLNFGYALLFLLGGLIAGVIFFVVNQFLNRIFFECIMMFVGMPGDVRKIRRQVVGNEASDSTFEQTAPVAAPQAAPRAAAQATAPMNAAPVNAAAPQGTWNCSCGATGITGGFCYKCGSPRK